MKKQDFFIEGKYMGHAMRSNHTDASGITFSPISLAFFCQKCGDVWARIVVEGAPFRIEYGVCRKHPVDTLWTSSEWPGSLYRPWLSFLVDDLPDEVVRREFHLHLKHYKES